MDSFKAFCGQAEIQTNGQTEQEMYFQIYGYGDIKRREFSQEWMVNGDPCNLAMESFCSARELKCSI